jgi:hypothetical protein
MCVTQKNVNMCFNLTNDYRLRLTNDRPDLSSERALNKIQDSKIQTSTFWRKTSSGHKSQSGLDTKTYWLTDCQSQSNSESDWPTVPSNYWHLCMELHDTRQYVTLKQWSSTRDTLTPRTFWGVGIHFRGYPEIFYGTPSTLNLEPALILAPSNIHLWTEVLARQKQSVIRSTGQSLINNW